MGTLRTPQRLGDHFIYDAGVSQVLCSELHHFAGFVAAGGILPQNAGKPFRAEHRVDGVFQHQQAVGYAQSQRTAAGAFARDHSDHGNSQAAELGHAPGNGFALAPFLGFLAGVGARRIQKGQDGAAELFGLLHQTQGLAVPLRPRHPKVAAQILL